MSKLATLHKAETVASSKAVSVAKNAKKISRLVPNAVSSRFGRAGLHLAKNSPQLLFVGGVVGVVATTVLACRATLKLEETLEEIAKDKIQAKEVLGLNREDYSEKDFRKDMAYLQIRSIVRVTKLYTPTVVVGTLSIAALTGAHNIQQTRIAGITAAYSAVEKAFGQYRARVVDEYGEEKDRELRYGVEKSVVLVEDRNGAKKEKVKHFSDGGSQYSRLFNSSNPNWEPSREHMLLFLKAQQNWANDRLQAKGHLFLNDVYGYLGLTETSAGSVTGWIYDPDRTDGQDNFVDFGVWQDENLTKFYDFMCGREDAILLDFNVNGLIWDLI